MPYRVRRSAAGTLTVLLIGWTGSVARGELKLTLREGSQNWNYGTSETCSGYVQKWNGTDVILETEVVFPTEGKPGPFPRESWFGFFLQDATHKHRYCPGLYNGSFSDSPRNLTFGVPRYEAGGNWDPIATKASVKTGVGRCRLRLVFHRSKRSDRPGELQLAYRVAAKEWKTVWSYEAPGDLTPDRIGLCADSYRESKFGPVIFKYFRLIGQGPAKDDPFDGSVDAAQTWELLNDRMDAHSPMKYRGKLLRGPDEFAFERGVDIKIGIRAETTMLVGKTVDFEFIVRDQTERIVHRKTYRGKLAQERNDLWFAVPSSATSRYGVYALEVEARRDAARLGTHRGQFAVIPTRKITAALDPNSPYTMCYGLSPRLAARLGFRRYRTMWAPWTWSVGKRGQFISPSLDKQVTECRRVGLLCVGPLGPRNIGQSTRDLKAWIDYHSKAILGLYTRYTEAVQIIEAGNEPENWPIEPIENQWLLEGFGWSEVAHQVHQKFAQVKISTTSTTHVNLAVINQCLRMGGASNCDWVAVHGYRSPAPPEFGHTAEIEAIRDMAAEMPIWDTESQYFTYATPARDSEVNAGDYQAAVGGAGKEYWQVVGPMTQAAYIPRYYMSKFAAGYSGVASFGRELSASLTHHHPSMVSVAYLTKLLAHPEFVGRLAPLYGQLQALQFRSEQKKITAVWSLQPWLRVGLTAKGKVQVYDLFGNEVLVVPVGNTITLSVGQAPIYVVGPITGVASTAKWSRNDPRPAVVTEEEIDWVRPARLRLRIEPALNSLRRSRIALVVENATQTSQAGTASLAFALPVPGSWELKPVGSSRFTLTPGKSRAISFEVVSRDPAIQLDPYHPASGRGYAVTSSMEGYFFRASVKTNVGRTWSYSPRFGLCLRGIPKLARFRVDAKPDEWARVPDWPAGSPQARRNAGLAKSWSGPADFSPAFKFGWTDNGLAFLAVVHDDWHHQPHEGLQMWRCDSVQLGLNPTPQQIDFINYLVLTLGLTPKGVQCVLQRDAFGLGAGPAFEVNCAIVRQPGGYDKGNPVTTYEALIPWELLRGFTPSPGNYLGFSVLFSDSDGWERKGWQGAFLNTGGQIVDPRRFGDITLIDETR